MKLLVGNNKFLPFLRIHLSIICQFCPNGGTIPQKRGEYFCCPPIFLCVLDEKFNVDYDSAIKHDLTQCFHKVMDVQSQHPKKGKSPVSYLKQLFNLASLIC